MRLVRVEVCSFSCVVYSRCDVEYDDVLHIAGVHVSDRDCTVWQFVFVVCLPCYVAQLSECENAAYVWHILVQNNMWYFAWCDGM